MTRKLKLFFSISFSLCRLTECMLHFSSVSLCIFFWRWNTQKPGFECETPVQTHRMAINFTFNWLSISFNRKNLISLFAYSFYHKFSFPYKSWACLVRLFLFFSPVFHAYVCILKLKTKPTRTHIELMIVLLFFFSTVSCVAAVFSTVENLVFDMDLMPLFSPFLILLTCYHLDF